MRRAARLRRVDPERLADLYLALMTPKGVIRRCPPRASVGVFARCSPHWSERVPAHLTGQPTAGIGAAMRIAPIPLYFGDEIGPMFDVGHGRQSDDSPRYPQSQRRAGGRPRDPPPCRRRTPRPQSAFRVASDLVKDEKRIAEASPTSSSSSTAMPAACRRPSPTPSRCSSLPRDRALAALVEEANRHGADPACKRPTMGFPPACIPTCLYLLLTTDSFEEALTEVVNLGGDTDTAGAILGAMAGAHYGVDAIPTRWLDGLQNREGIEARAIALAQRSTRGLHIPT